MPPLETDGGRGRAAPAGWNVPACPELCRVLWWKQAKMACTGHIVPQLGGVRKGFLPPRGAKKGPQAATVWEDRLRAKERKEEDQRMGKRVMVQATATTVKRMAGRQDILNMVGWSYPP